MDEQDPNTYCLHAGKLETLHIKCVFLGISPIDIRRLFIAFELPANAKARLAEILAQLNSACLAESVSPRTIKWVNPESIHLTTQFLGDTDRARIQEIKDNISAIHHQSDKRPFILQAKTIGAFPNLNRPRVIWTDLSGADLKRMSHIAEVITNNLVNIKCLSDTRPFKPHLTLGRIRRDTPPQSFQTIAETASFAPIRIVFETLTLFASELTPQGPIHTPLQSWQFDAS